MIKRALDIPDNVKLVAITPLGYPAEEAEQKKRKSLSEMVHHESF